MASEMKASSQLAHCNPSRPHICVMNNGSYENLRCKCRGGVFLVRVDDVVADQVVAQHHEPNAIPDDAGPTQMMCLNEVAPRMKG